MFEQTVLGVDPGTASVGVAVVARSAASVEVRWTATVRTGPGAAPQRLLAIHDRIRQVIDEHRPDAMAVERLMWGRNTRSAMEVARASGVIVLAAAQAGIPVEEYAPLEVKMAVTGVGNAPKETVRSALARLIGVRGVPSEPDAADAVAVAVCHLQQARMRRLVAAGRSK